MTHDRKSEIESFIFRAISGFGIDASKPFQSMGLIGLSEMNREIPQNELISVLKNMDGVVFDFEASPAQVRIPTTFFL